MNTYYAANLLIFAGVDIIACLALNLQFGVSGVVNFSFIIFQAAGAYAAAILSMPPDTAPDYSFQMYVGGYQLPFPIPWIGGALAGLSGAILVGFLQVWAPSTWLYPETIILFAAVIVGGRGNNVGAILGALLVPVGFEEVTRLLGRMDIGPPNLIPALEWVCIGLLILGFLWFRPKGVVPEERRVFPGAPVAADDSRWVEGPRAV